MTFSQLQYLLEIYRVGSVTQAAKNLFVSQSSVSIALGALEKELGFPVFDRGKRGLVPTPKGMDTIAHAKRIVESYRQMTKPAEQPWINVRLLAANIEPAENAFLRLVRENRGRKDLRFSLRSGSAGLALDLLRFFNLDVAVFVVLEPRFLGRQASFKKEGLELHSLGIMPAAVQIGEGHPLFDAPSVSLEDLANDALLEFPTKATSEGLLDAGVLQVNDERFLITNHEKLRSQLVREGHAFAITPMLSVRKNPQDGIRSIPLENLQYHVCVATNPRQPFLPEAERYLELLQEELKDAGICQAEKG